MRTPLLRLLQALGLMFAGTGVASTAAPPPTVVVFAAASLAEVLQELGDAYQRASGVAVRISFASSAVLARQIEAGAPADAYLAADTAWMDLLQSRSLLQAGSRRTLAGNQLVLIAPADSKVVLQVAPGAALAAALAGGRLATGDPDSVPLGRYARAALQRLGLWASVADQLVYADDARSALAFVARGEAPLGIAYATDARSEPRVRVVSSFPTDSYPPIIYEAALLRGATPAAAGFLGFLGGEAARARFAHFGFRPR